MKRWLSAVFFPLALAAVPVPLVTGAVRDRSGAPVAGARVTAGSASALTAADGTFVLRAAASNVRITCAYCRDTDAPVEEDGTVTAIVTRYTAVSQNSPSDQDLRSLPYAVAESVLSLRPYTVLYDSRRPLPGPVISFMGIGRHGALVVDDGVPSYDIASGATPFREFPAYSLSEFDVRDASDAPRYGDLAGGGTYVLDTLPASVAAALSAGDERAARVGASMGGFSLDAAASSDIANDRARFDAAAQRGIFSANIFASSNNYGDSREGSVDGTVSAAHLHAQRDGALTFYGDAYADRGAYSAAFSRASAWDGWSDAAIGGGVISSSNVQLFADAGTRYSSGAYGTGSAYYFDVAGGIAQSHVTVGAQTVSGAVAYKAMLGAFDVRYGNGALDSKMLLPSIQASLQISPSWSVSAESVASYRIPPLLEQYYDAPDLPFSELDRVGTNQLQVDYGDGRRLRAGVAVQRSSVIGLGGGSVSSAGGFVAWQISPELSLRAWTLHANDSTQPSELDATPAVAWASYRSAALSADFIWRRDIVDRIAQPHLDGSLGVPLTGSLWIVAGSEMHGGVRYTSLSVRFDR